MLWITTITRAGTQPFCWPLVITGKNIFNFLWKCFGFIEIYFSFRSKFTYINIGSAGKNNDSCIFERSSLKKCHERDKLFVENSSVINNVNVPVLLIGDSAFRLSRYLLKPYPFKTNQPPNERNFNYHLSKCRRVIENAFGQLKARFRKIGKGLEVAPHNCNVVIKACCLLHNFLKDQQDDVVYSWLEEAQALSCRIQPSSTTTIGNNNVDGKAIRDAIAASFRKHYTINFAFICFWFLLLSEDTAEDNDNEDWIAYWEH